MWDTGKEKMENFNSSDKKDSILFHFILDQISFDSDEADRNLKTEKDSKKERMSTRIWTKKMKDKQEIFHFFSLIFLSTSGKVSDLFFSLTLFFVIEFLLYNL